jgi:hypothetical protein
MRHLLLLTLLSLSFFQLHAAINPDYKECLQRGYSLSGDSCVFPDGSACDLDAFNNGECGQEWMTDDYCVEEGEYVWDDDRCCEGLEPYLEKGVDGQATCEKISAGGVDPDRGERNSMYWILLIAFIMLIIISIYLKKRREVHAFSPKKSPDKE